MKRAVCGCGCGEQVKTPGSSFLRGHNHRTPLGETKHCFKCARDRPLDAFPLNKSNGRPKPQCKECRNRYRKEWVKRNEDRERGYQQKYREKNHDSMLAAQRARRAANLEEYRQRDREAKRKQNALDPIPNRQRVRQWQIDNPDKVVQQTARRRARKAAAFVEDVDPVAVYIMSYGLCGICGLPVEPNNMHVDHVLPLSKGGLHEYRNCQAAHSFCNQSKHNSLQLSTPLATAPWYDG